MRFLSRGLLIFLFLTLTIVVNAGVSSAVTMNEIRIDQPGTDNDEYIELSGTPGESLNGVSLIVIGDASTAGLGGGVECIVDFDGYSIQSDGFFLVAETTYTLGGTVDMVANLNFENSDNVTFLLVTNRNDSLNVGSGYGGSDVDQDDDGVIDASGDYGGDGGDDGAPWTSILDSVALVETVGSGDLIYSTTTVGPDGSYVPGHVYLCPDVAGTWKIGQFTTGVDDTPGAANPSCLSPAPDFTNEVRVPCTPVVGQTATVTAMVTNATSAEVHYTVNGGTETVLSMSVTATSGDTTTFETTLPGQSNNGDLVEYFVRAYNANPDTTDGHNQGYFVGTVNIGDVRVNDANGYNIYRYYGVRFTGTATVPYGVFSSTNTDYYMQDATGGINVFQFGAHSVHPNLGDNITVAGALDQYRGKLEVSPAGPCDTLMVEINGPGTPPEAKLVDTCTLGEAEEGQLVRMKIVQLPADADTLEGNTSYWVRNCYPDSIQMFVDADTDIPGTVATSQYIDVVGIAGQYDYSAPYDGSYQIIPRFASDLTFLTTTGLGDRSNRPVARLLQNSPNPFRRNTEIRYTVPSGAGAEVQVPVKLRVFDIHGRVVATLVDGLQSPGEKSVNLSREALNGAGDGIYFYQLKVGNETFTRKLVLAQ